MRPVNRIIIIGTAITAPSTGGERDPTVALGLGSTSDFEPTGILPAHKIQGKVLSVGISQCGTYVRRSHAISNYSPVVYTEVLLTTGDDTGSVQTVENVPVVSNATFEELIRRVQSPVPLADSLLKVQLGPILTWIVLPTEGSIARPSSPSPLTCTQKQFHHCIVRNILYGQKYWRSKYLGTSPNLNLVVSYDILMKDTHGLGRT